MNVLPIHVEKQAELLHRADPRAPFILIRAALQVPLDWVSIDKIRAPVTRCASPLAVRSALQAVRTEDLPHVILFNGDENELGDDVLARCARQRMRPIDPWSIVATLLRVAAVDPALRQMPWLADLLVEAGDAAAGGPSTVLEADRAWAIVERQVLGLQHSPPSDDDLYACALDVAWRARWLALPAAARQSFRERWTPGARLAQPLCDAIEAGHGERLLAVGLLCDALARSEAEQELLVAQSSARLESLIGGRPLGADQRTLFANAAIRHSANLADDAALAANAQMAALADEVHTSILVANARFGSAALERVLSDAARAIADATSTVTAADIDPVLRALRDLVWPRVDGRLLEQLVMAARLCRWSLTWTEPAPVALSELAERYVGSEAWADWARIRLRDGTAHHALALAFDGLARAAAVRRKGFDRVFAERLAEPMPNLGRLPLIEQVIDEYAAPAIAEERALFIVLDGMSWASCLELATDLTRLGWVPALANGVKGVGAALTMLPSTTEASRASLLVGSATRGDRTAERDGFARQATLARVAIAGKPPRLFHKAGLADAGDSRLADDLLTALRDNRQRHVGVILNAIDDHLAKSDQLRLRWSVDQLRWLDALLAEAAASERIVVLLSDHGHVLDSGGEQTTSGRSARWREPDLQRFDGEIQVSGERVDAGSGMSSVVLAWDERVRYTARRNGYHGGANPAECLVPCVLLLRTDRLSARWQANPIRPPAWWGSGPVPPESNS